MIHSRKISLDTTAILFVASLFLFTSCRQSKPTTQEARTAFESVIPKPVSATLTGKTFFLTKETVILVETVDMMEMGQYLSARLKPATGFDLPVKVAAGNPPDGSIYLAGPEGDSTLGEEGYALAITDDLIRLTSRHPVGLFYGIQTLRQLLPPKIEETTAQEGPWEIATGTIKDQPAYAWRGSMLDVARHFSPVEDVKRYIDLIAMYKMNILHLHLSDDQGWRIEIKSWPELALKGGITQVGGGKGGYYTQTQYADIVAYAQRQFITIVPEIDLPGHINAALASYAELNAGIPIHVEPGRANPAPGSQAVSAKPTPGVVYTGIEVGFSTLRLEKEATFRFVEDVIRELASITPGPYLHIGGDEAAVTKKEDYKIFINRFQEIVTAHGKKMIGWEEIAQAKIGAGVLAQHWHSAEYGQMAVEKGAKLIMSPATTAYLDMQYDSTTRLGLHWAGYHEVDAAYTWDPATQIPGVGKENIVGVEAALWGETIRNMDDIEYMMFPRLPATAEVAWSPMVDRKWDEFKVRVSNHGKRWTIMGIDYYKSVRIPWVE